MNKRKRKKHFKKYFPLGWGLGNFMGLVKQVILDVSKKEQVKKESLNEQA